MFKNKIKFFLLTVIVSFLLGSNSFSSGSIRVADITTNFKQDIEDNMNNTRMIRVNFNTFPEGELAIKDDREALFYNQTFYETRDRYLTFNHFNIAWDNNPIDLARRSLESNQMIALIEISGISTPDHVNYARDFFSEAIKVAGNNDFQRRFFPSESAEDPWKISVIDSLKELADDELKQLMGAGKNVTNKRNLI